jgi:hypothetical protein
VQSPLFSELFLLSRAQHPSDADVDVSLSTDVCQNDCPADIFSQAWLAEAESLGTSLTLVTKFSQENCLFT